MKEQNHPKAYCQVGMQGRIHVNGVISVRNVIWVADDNASINLSSSGKASRKTTPPHVAVDNQPAYRKTKARNFGGESSKAQSYWLAESRTDFTEIKTRGYFPFFRRVKGMNSL